MPRSPLPGVPGIGAPAAAGKPLISMLAFELVGVGALTILADTNRTLGGIIVLLMVSFLLIWFMTTGAKTVAPFINSMSKATGG